MKMEQKFFNFVSERDKKLVLDNFRLAVTQITEEHFNGFLEYEGDEKPLLNSRDFIKLALKRAVELAGVIIEGMDDFVEKMEESNHGDLFKISLSVTAVKVRENDKNNKKNVLNQGDTSQSDISKEEVKKKSSKYDNWADYGKLASNDND